MEAKGNVSVSCFISPFRLFWALLPLETLKTFHPRFDDKMRLLDIVTYRGKRKFRTIATLGLVVVLCSDRTSSAVGTAQAVHADNEEP